MIEKPLTIKPRNITSIDVTSMIGGLDERGDYVIQKDSFSKSTNMIVNGAGLATVRQGLRRWLPDTVDTVYQVYPVLYGGDMYYFVADDSKIKYCKTGDTAWTDCGGSNTCTTGANIINTFIRALDTLIVTNGVDNYFHVDLATLDVIKLTAVTDPTNPPTATATGITLSGASKIYYSIAFNGANGDTKNSPILTTAVSKSRLTWKTDGSEFITITRNNSAPTGATSWNLYASLAPQGGTIADSDMLMLQAGIDLSVTSFVDNGAIPINISAGTAPQDNSTDGFKAKYAMENLGRPILYGINGDEYAIRFGGDGDSALDFSPNNGGFRLEVNKGTNYYPTSIVGFRSGQGVPSLTLLSSNTQGVAKQFIVEQNTVTYGDTSIVVWGATEQNYGATSLSSAYAVVNHMGSLLFPTMNGFMSMNTQPSQQNVLSTQLISPRIPETYGSMRTDQLNKIVGTPWGDSVYFTAPVGGYTFNNKILIYDSSRKENPIWYTMDIRAQWIGVVSPNNRSSFVYVCRDNHIFRLEDSYASVDENDTGLQEIFPISITGPLVSPTSAHNVTTAINQAVFYLADFIGEVEVGVTYRTNDGRVKTKTKTITRGSIEPTRSGSWDDSGYLFDAGQSTYQEWDDILPISVGNGSTKTTVRVKLPMNNELITEAQYFLNSSTVKPTYLTLAKISFEGVTIGVKGDLV